MTARFPITIYHNPRCTTSRNVLALIRAAGHEPEIVEYLIAGWTRAELERLFAAMNKPPRALLRLKGTPAAELGLADPDVGDERILAAMIRHPVLVERPIVVSPKGVILARPPEAVRDLF
jgi:arsenate reductase (glutaredoxin)